jgi:hypothetical protein
MEHLYSRAQGRDFLPFLILPIPDPQVRGAKQVNLNKSKYSVLNPVAS